jgi:integrase/recombinase XerD
MPDSPKGSKTRVFLRPKSKFLYIEYIHPITGERVRESSGEITEAAAWKELNLRVQRAGEPSWKDAVVHFFEERNDLRPATKHQYLNSVRALDPYLRKLLLSEIVGSVLKQFMADRRKVVKDPSVRRDLATGSSIFSTAQATMPRQVPEANPFRLLSKRHLKEVKRRRYLTPDEYTRIESALTLEWHRVALEVFVYTGMRHGEVRAFKKDWIHWDSSEHGEIHLPQELTKTNEPRVLPMFPKLNGTLKGWCARQPGDYVFSHWSQPDQAYIPFASFQPFWTRVKLRAGVKDVRIHDLRHTFASWWIQKGGDMMALRDMLGHADLRMTERYAHLNSEAQHRAIREVGDLM